MGFQLLFIPQSGTMTILVMAPKIARGGGGWMSFQLLFIPQSGTTTILVTAPKIARGGGNFW